MGKYIAQFHALARKNLSLQLRRKGSTFCQIFIPISVALIVGISTVISTGSGVEFSNNTVWNEMGIEYPPFVNVSYLSPTDQSSLPVGVLSPDINGNNSGLMGNCPQGIYAFGINYSLSPFLGTEFLVSEKIDEYFTNQLNDTQNCGQMCGALTQDTSAAIYFYHLEANQQIFMNFTVQAGNNLNLNSLGVNIYSNFRDDVTIYSYFLSMVHNSMYRSQTNNNSLFITGFLAMPYKNSGADIGNLFSLIMLPFATSFLFSVFLYSIVLEKKEGLVQKMQTSGLSMPTYWIVTYVYNLLLYLFITAVLFIFGIGFGIPAFVLRPTEMIILLFLWGNAQVAMCNLLTCFFWNPILASITGYVLSICATIIGFVLEFFIFLQNPTNMPYRFYLIYPGFAFYHGFGLLVLSIVDVRYPISLLPGSLFSNILLILIFETVGLLVVTWYLDSILPREIGVKRNPLFPILALLQMFKKNTRAPERKPLLVQPSINVVEDEDVARERDLVRNSQALVRIIELTKEYPGSNRKSSKLALDHVSFRIWENECFGLLGPNGAGKTTLLNILCGTIAPTSGVAYIDELTITNNLHDISKIIGICPQFDVLWPELTVKEHLQFYLRLKGLSTKKEATQVDEIIEQVGLEEVAKRAARGLSGGQKRRLSIAIAMMGKPKLIFMDEPTTGLDPSSRRALWDVIIKAKEKYSIALSTHSMEEAEVLCNRIGIMRKARLHSIGTQMHLKNKFELGYNIKISHFLSCEEKAHAFVMETVPTAVLVRAAAGKRAYKVPKGDFLMSDLFKKMELNKYRQGIKEWNISQANLEEVFLAIVTEDEGDETNP